MAFDKKKYQAEYYQRNKERLNEYKKEYQARVTKVNQKQLAVNIDRDVIEAFEKKLLKDGITKADFFRKIINDYLKK